MQQSRPERQVKGDWTFEPCLRYLLSRPWRAIAKRTLKVGEAAERDEPTVTSPLAPISSVASLRRAARSGR